MNDNSQLVREGEVLYLQGRLDFQSANRLYRLLKQELNHDIHVMDCSRVEQCDSSAIGLLLAGCRLAEKRNIQVEIRGMNEQMRSLARLYEVEQVLGRAKTGHTIPV